jgi:ABC-type lipoprotein release transport system permease subunit
VSIDWREETNGGRARMTAVWYRFRAELRTRWRAWLALALIAGIAGGAVLALAAGGRRTDTAYRRFLHAQDAYDALVSLSTTGFGQPDTEFFDAEEIERLPQVAEAAPTGSFFVSLGAGVGVLVPPDERIGTEINEFKVLDGRRADPDDPTEAVVSFTLAEQYDLEVGSEIEVLDPSIVGALDEPPPPDVTPDQAAALRLARDRVLATLPDNSLTVVGIEASPGNFPPQIEGTGRYLIHASPALYPLRHDLAQLSEGGDELMVRLHRGARDTDAFLAELERLGAGEGDQLVVQRDLATAVDRSLHTQAVALRLLALLAAVAGALIVGQLLARLTFLESDDHPVLTALGMRRGERFALGLARAATIGLAAALFAVVLAVIVSPLFPTGLARTAEPDPGVDVDAALLGVGALGLAVVVVLLGAWPAWRAARPTTGTEPVPMRPSVAGRMLAQAGAPLSVSAGVRMALEPGRGRSSVPVRSSLAGVALGVVTLVAAITFGASLAHLLATPALYGQTWDVELTMYDETLATRGLSVLEEDDRVEGIVVGIFRASFAVDERRVDGFVFDTVDGDISPTILEGRRPRADDEIALGTRTLRSLGIDVGDTVPVAPFATNRDPVPMRIVGRVVFPVFGEAGRLGDGVFVNKPGWERVLGEPLNVADTGLLLRLTPGVTIDAVVADLEEQVGSSVFVIGQGKPTDIVNFGRVEATPYLLGGILAALSTATLTHVLVSGVRRRRRELAILKTLGFVRGQVRSTVAWQATTLVAVALLVGVPVGIATGRWAWMLFAENLGVVAAPRVPAIAIAVTVAVAFLVANLIAAAPAQFAARTKPALVLRSE